MFHMLKRTHLIEMVLLSNHNIHFDLEIRKLIFNYTLLYRGQAKFYFILYTIVMLTSVNTSSIMLEVFTDLNL